MVKPSSKVKLRSVQDREKLITEVSKFECIWKKDDPNYHNRDCLRNSWETISSETKIPVEECKLTWKNLRDAFAAKLKRVKSGKSGDGREDVTDGSKAKKRAFYDQLLFLEDTMIPRKTESNFEDGNDEIKQQNSLSEHEDSDRSLPLPSPVGEISSEEFPDRSVSGILTPKFNTKQFGKRTQASMVMEELGKHLKVVGQSISTPIKSDPFFGYLEKIIEGVPDAKKRKCEQQILLIANAFAEGKDNQIQIVELLN